MFPDLAELRADTLTRLGDADNTIWSNGEVDDYLEEGYEELVVRGRALWDQEYVNDLASTPVYPLPSDLALVDRVVWNGRTLPAIGSRELRMADARYNTIEGNVDRYAINIDGPRTMRKYRVPSVSASNTKTDQYIDTEVVENTRIEFFRYGADLDSNPYEIPRHWARKTRHYAMWRALDRDGPGQDLKVANHFKLRWSIALLTVEQAAGQTTQARHMRLGGEPQTRPYVRRPRLPWEYGRVVR